MKIHIQKEDLGNAVADVARFAERRSATLPVLSAIVLSAGDAGITLQATNLETGISRKLAGDVVEAGTIAIPATIAREISASFSGTGSITLEQVADTVILFSGSIKSTIKTLSHEDFPVLPFPESPKATFSIPGALFKAVVSAVVSCASSSTIRPELASVLISGEGGKIKAVATDSFRLAEKYATLEGKSVQFSMLIPARNVGDILQVLPDTDIEITLDEHQCSFMWPEGKLTTRLVAANYPDYTSIIPKSFAAEATVLKKDFESALRRATVFSDSFQKMRLSIEPTHKKIGFSSRNNDVGESSESISANISGDAVELSFNHRYLAAPLPLITTENLTLSASGIGRPLVMRGSGDASYLYLVMPMNQ